MAAAGGGQRPDVQHAVQVFPGRLQIASRSRSHIVTPLLAVLGESKLAADRWTLCLLDQRARLRGASASIGERDSPPSDTPPTGSTVRRADFETCARHGVSLQPLTW